MELKSKTYDKKLRLVFLSTHAIQYLVPLYRECAQSEKIEVKVWYCSDYGLKASYDKQFGTSFKYDVSLTDGYEYKILKNYNRNGTHQNGRRGLMNFSIISELFRQPRSLIIIGGWAYVPHILAYFFAPLFGHKVAIRAETNLINHQLKSLKRQMISTWFFKALSKFISYYLYVGKKNKALYRHFGVDEEKLIFTPYSVENERFEKQVVSDKKEISCLKTQLGVPLDKRVFLFSGKYIGIKRPMDILKAFRLLRNRNEAFLIFMGEGELRGDMERYCKANGLSDSVLLTGFVNQTNVAQYYNVSDVLVMSSMSETWGLSVNEAMVFANAIIASKTVGCADDLVINGENGFVYSTGNIDELCKSMSSLLKMSEDELLEFKRRSVEIVRGYSNLISVKSILNEEFEKTLYS